MTDLMVYTLGATYAEARCIDEFNRNNKAMRVVLGSNVSAPPQALERVDRRLAAASGRDMWQQTLG